MSKHLFILLLLTCPVCSGYDVLLRDNTIWPAAVLEELLQVPSVELIPTHLAAPLYSFDQSIPNPIAYVPQFGSGLYPIMVSMQIISLPLRMACLQ